MNLTRNRRVQLGIGAAGILTFGVFFFLFRQLIWYVLIAAVAAGVIWIAGYFALQALRRRKQQRFDAGVAAKEGIEDRKREWSSWTEELEKQGIDRYELPFYLLVGEPQSGKSVLLQNSDLNFPFGQTRLSGIGGTRGCDWWFTEEAVILDLAGRLFTHEGGASDEAEWGAFLELLAAYRPMCPANGVLLVIPCDGLSTDSREEAGRKASQIQNALLTLANKLQAQVPIYVILTKADRIFGFAETVHRQTVEKRQEMFGWSRAAEHFDAPFDIVEVRRAFDGMVGRARLLRETMLSTIRLPEGIPEVDRMYAFPDELAALYPNLEIYLKRIFSESALVDRLYFRGLYLTSGLQSGAPIAKVCAELLGGVGEADKRELESLFSKQHAYFIKDLIRRRVFSERGLVRPTQARVLRNRRRAWIGYGAAAAIALVSVVASLYYVLSDYDDSSLERFRRAIGTSIEVANTPDPDLESQLDALEATWRALDVRERTMETGMISRRPSFERLYERLCDLRLVPTLRRAAERAAGARLERAPADAAEFLTLVEQVRLLLAGFDPADPKQTDTLLALLPAKHAQRAAEALERRRHLDQDVPPSLPERDEDGRPGAALRAAAVRIESLWDRTLRGGDPLQIDGAAGYLVAWRTLTETFAALEGIDPARLPAERQRGFLEDAAAYHDAYVYLHDPASTRELVSVKEGVWELSKRAVDRRLADLEATRTDFRRARLGEGRDGASRATWDALAGLRDFETSVAFPGKQARGNGSVSEDLVNEYTDRKAEVPTRALEGLFDPELEAACDPDFLVPSAEGCSLPRLPETLGKVLGDLADQEDSLARRVIYGKLRVLQAWYLDAFPDVDSLAAELAPEAGTGGSRSVEVLEPVLRHLLDLREHVGRSAPPGQESLSAPWSRAIEERLAAALDEVGPAIARLEGSSSLDVRLLGALGRAAAIEGPIAAAAGRASSDYLALVDGELARRWGRATEEPAETVRVLEELARHVATVRETRGASPLESHSRWLAREVSPLLLSRLAVHRKALQRANRPPYGKSLVSVAGAIKAKLTPQALREWQATLESFDVLDPKGLEPHIAELAREPELARAAAELDAFRRAATRVTNPVNNAYCDFLIEFVEPLCQETVVRDGEELARVLSDGRAQHPSAPPESAVESYLEGLFQELDQLAVQELRGHYLTDLEEQLGKRDDLKRALFSTDLDDSNDHRAEIAAQLKEFFDPGGAFDQLQRQYLQSGSNPLRFRPEGDSEDDGDWWACDRFLRGLRAFLQDGDPKARISASEVSIYMEPGSETGGVWEYPWLFTSFQEDGDALPTGSVGRQGPLTWRFDNTQDEFSFRWSRAAGKPQSDDARIVGDSCLAPLILCWSSPFNDSQEGGSLRWPIEFPIRSGLDARFVLEFTRELPHRPPRPW